MGRREQSMPEVLPSLWDILRYFSPYLRRERLVIATSFGMLVVATLLHLMEPWPLKFIIDRVVPAKRPGNLQALPLIDRLDIPTLVVAAALAVVVISLVRAAADFGSKVCFFLVGKNVICQVRDDVFRHLHALSLPYHYRSKRGDLIVRVTRDVSMLRDVASTAILPLVANLFILVGMVAVMAWLEWRLLLLSLAIVPLFWITTLRLGRKIRRRARKQREREGAMAAVAAESIEAIEVVQSLSLEYIFTDRFADQNRQGQKEDFKANRYSARLERTVDVLMALATALVMWYGTHLVLQSRMSPGDLLVFLVYLKRAVKPAQNFAKYMSRLAKAAAAGERVISLLQETPDVCDAPGAVDAPCFRGLVQFDDVTFGYEPGQPVLARMNFEIYPGEQVALTGESGIGKSTLTRLLLRLYDPGHGAVRIDGHDLREFTVKSLRSQVSVVPQETVLFHASVWDNIRFGRPGATRNEIEAAARLANADGFIRNLPNGYDTVLGERGVTLSCGQRQRIAVARAAIRQAPLLILDEPTTGLDDENERAVVDALQQLSEDRTTILITHDLQLAVAADRILYLAGGSVLEHGTHFELMQADGRYAALFRLQSLSREHLDESERCVTAAVERRTPP